MEIDSQENWEIRKFLQQFPLIGTTSKNDDGNGYHDRISFYERGLEPLTTLIRLKTYSSNNILIIYTRHLLIFDMTDHTRFIR